MQERDNVTGKSVTTQVEVSITNSEEISATVNAWLEKMLSSKKSTVEKNELEPFLVKPYSLSQTGNLTIWFSKPIIKPPI